MSDAIERKIQDYLDGRLAPEDAEAFERRIAGDGALERRVEELREIGRALRDDGDSVSPGYYTRLRARFEEQSAAPARRGFRLLSWQSAGVVAAGLLLTVAFVPGLLQRDEPATAETGTLTARLQEQEQEKEERQDEKPEQRRAEPPAVGFADEEAAPATPPPAEKKQASGGKGAASPAAPKRTIAPPPIAPSPIAEPDSVKNESTGARSAPRKKLADRDDARARSAPRYEVAPPADAPAPAAAGEPSPIIAESVTQDAAAPLAKSKARRAEAEKASAADSFAASPFAEADAADPRVAREGLALTEKVPAVALAVELADGVVPDGRVIEVRNEREWLARVPSSRVAGRADAAPVFAPGTRWLLIGKRRPAAGCEGARVVESAGAHIVLLRPASAPGASCRVRLPDDGKPVSVVVGTANGR
ncbi:MAG: hypothetical protein GY716_03305 [bacterium]|nr:hypothetical protein [bacterium]